MALFNVAAEGNLDLQVARKLLLITKHEVDSEFQCGGKGNLDSRLSGFNAASQFSNWLVLRDLDQESECIANFALQKISPRNSGFVFRIAKQEVEAWLLADADSISEFLAISPTRIPRAPEELSDAKQMLTNLARKSRRREIREGIPPTETGGRSEGPAYTFLLSRYVQSAWAPEVAAQVAPTLQNTIQRLNLFA
jgi:hypothetical protein